MTYSELLQAVQSTDQLRIIDAAGNLVAAHAHLTPLFTNCLASDACGIQPTQMPQRPVAKCAPGSGCC